MELTPNPPYAMHCFSYKVGHFSSKTPIECESFYHYNFLSFKVAPLIVEGEILSVATKSQKCVMLESESIRHTRISSSPKENKCFFFLWASDGKRSQKGNKYSFIFIKQYRAERKLLRHTSSLRVIFSWHGSWHSNKTDILSRMISRRKTTKEKKKEKRRSLEKKANMLSEFNYKYRNYLKTRNVNDSREA